MARSARHTGGFRPPGEAVRQAAPFAPDLAIAPSGAAIVAWDSEPDEIFVAERRPGRPLQRAIGFAKRRPRTTIGDLEIGVDSVGRSVLAWIENSPDGSSRVRSAFRTIGGRMRLARVLGPATDLGTQGTAALDADGRTRLIWRNHSVVNLVRGRSR